MFTVGQLARRCGLSTRTVRFWSDLGLLPPSARSSGGYRLYDATAVARLELVRSLRQLDIGVADIRRILAERTSVREVAQAHAQALDAEIRTLRLRRAVLRSVARRGSTTEELRLMNDLARLSAAQRQQILDEFVAEVFAGVDPDSDGARLAESMRRLPVDLPDDPSDEEVDAWVELAELVIDPDFRQRVRQMAVAGAAAEPPAEPFPSVAPAREALAAGIAPDSAAARQVLDRLVDPALSGPERIALADRIATFTDHRVERYWQLIAVLNRRPSFPAAVPAMQWVVDALRASR